MEVQDIYIYPVKSLEGIRKTEARVLQRGFKSDRRWMLTDQNGNFISQRTEHKLALLTTTLTSNEIIVSPKNNPEKYISIPLASLSDNTITVSIWEDSVRAKHLNKKLDDWFSTYLGKACKLVFMPETTSRAVDKRYALHNEQVSFADAFPYLLIAQASLDDLNNRLDESVLMDRFRPGIVISGAKAYEEDTWAEIKIGDVHFKVAKPSARCVLINIDQQTAIKTKEPLYTLSKYRTVNNKVLFGQNLIALNEGVIKINDTLEIIRLK